MTLQRGHDLPEHERRDGPIPVIGSFGITGRHDTARARGPGVCVGRSGASFGVVTYSPVDFWPLNTALYVIDFHGNDERFSYYMLKNLDFSGFNSGSAQPSLNRNFIHPMPISVPLPDEQRAIASVLGALDDEIVLNGRMNETLEAMARALFKSWFVDFDPVRAKAGGEQPWGMDAATAALFPDTFDESELGETPQGWRVTTLDEVAAFTKGVSYKSVELAPSACALVTLKSFRRGGGYREDGLKPYIGKYKREQVITPGEVVVSHTDVTQAGDVLGRAVRVPPSPHHDSLVGSLDTVIVRPKNADLPNEFLYELLARDDFREHCFGYANGTTVLHLSPTALPRYQFVMPSPPILALYAAVVAPMYRRIDANARECVTLAALRDTLLPKLLSGEVRVGAAEKMVEAAT